MTDEDGNDIESCPHPEMKVYIDTGLELNKYDLLRIEG